MLKQSNFKRNRL